MLDELRERLKNSDEEARRSAVESLGGAGSREGMELLVAALGDESWRVRKTAEEVIEGYIGMEGLTGLLISSLRSEENAGLRNSSVAVLVKVGKGAIPALIEILHDPDRDIRKFAADILGEIGEKEGAGELIKALRDPDENVRTASAEALGKIGGDEVIGALLSILSEDDLWLRFSALEALGKIGKGIPVDPISRLLEDRLLRKAALEALGKSSDPASIPHILPFLTDKSRNTREAAIVSIVRIFNSLSDQGKAVAEDEIRRFNGADALLDNITSTNQEVLKGTLELLGILGGVRSPERILELANDEQMQDLVARTFIRMGKHGSQTLVKAFDSSSDKMRAFICKVIGDLGREEDTWKVLLKGLIDSYGHTRQMAALSIAKAGKVDDLRYLIPLLTDEYEDVEEAGVKAIIAIGKMSAREVIERLLDGLSGREARLRRNITMIFGGIGGETALPALISSLKDEDKDVRKAAAVALGTIQMVETVDHLAISLTDENSQVRLAGVNSLARFKNDEAERLLMLAVADEDIWVRCAAIKGLARHGSGKALEVITALIENENGMVAITAINAIAEAKGLDAKDDLLKGLSHRDPEVAKTAERLLKRLGGVRG